MNTLLAKSQCGLRYAWGPTAAIRGEEPVERLASLRFGPEHWDEVKEFEDPDGLVSTVLFEGFAKEGNLVSRCGEIVVVEPKTDNIEGLIEGLVKRSALVTALRTEANRLKRVVPENVMAEPEPSDRLLRWLISALRKTNRRNEATERWIRDLLRHRIGSRCGIGGIATWHAFTTHKVDIEALRSRFPEAYDATVTELVTRRLRLENPD